MQNAKDIKKRERERKRVKKCGKVEYLFDHGVFIVHKQYLLRLVDLVFSIEN